MSASSTASPWPAPVPVVAQQPVGSPLPPPTTWTTVDSTTTTTGSSEAIRRETSSGTFAALAKRLSNEERALRAATKAEQKLRQQLIDLPSGWFVLHSVDIGQPGRLIDHVVIGPGGVFTLNVEHQPGAKVWVSDHQVLIDGLATEHLRHSRFEARRSSTLLTEACRVPVTVQSLLVLIGAAEVQTSSRPAEVHVRTEHEIRDWLCRQPDRLDADTVLAIHDRAGQFRTWQPSPGVVPPA